MSEQKISSVFSGDWRVEYENDVSTGFDGDEAFWEWWEVTNGSVRYKCDTEREALDLLGLIDGNNSGLPMGAPDGYMPIPTTEQLADALENVRSYHDMSAELIAPELLANLLAATTVKAEQAPTPEFVWVRLLEALAGDNGCPFTASTDDYREAKPALVQLIAAGFFRDDADSLDGDIWTIAAGEQSEAAARFASCADAYAVLSDVLNRVFERPDEAPSLPAAGSTVEEVEVMAVVTTAHKPGVTEQRALWHGEAGAENWVKHFNARGCRTTKTQLMTVAQHERIVAALSAQQSAHVSVPRELLERAMYAKDGRELIEANRELRALLNGGEA
jgi:hypothetical protein